MVRLAASFGMAAYGMRWRAIVDCPIAYTSRRFGTEVAKYFHPTNREGDRFQATYVPRERPMVIRHLIAIISAAIALASADPCSAQSERGSITGVIQDTSKAAIPGVSVKVINTSTNAATDVVSSESGAYNAANLSPGTYRI